MGLLSNIACLVFLFSSPAAAEDLQGQLIGTWCLNTEEYEGEVSVDGSLWTFKEDGTYVMQQAYVSEDKYRLEGKTLILENFGNMSILSIGEKEMKTEVYSTYHFTRDECLPLVAEAFQLTKLNNAIISKNMSLTKELAENGIDISKPDTRSALTSTPLIVAIKHGGREFVEYILSLEPDLSVTDGTGRTAREIAEKQGDQAILRLLESAAEETPP